MTISILNIQLNYIIFTMQDTKNYLLTRRNDRFHVMAVRAALGMVYRLVSCSHAVSVQAVEI